MNENTHRSLTERVERLESEVEELRLGLRLAPRGMGRAPAATSPTIPGTAGVARVGAEGRDTGGRSGSGRRFGWPFDLGDLGRGEWWLEKTGIGLLLFGVAFLFMFSVERGWISPPVRVALGLAMGATLLAGGLRLHGRRQAFARVLLGGGVGALYITGFAAFQRYELLPYPLAFTFMVAVTLLAYSLSLRQDEPSLSVIGALGGLGTPFLLYGEAGTLEGLVAYTCLILAGTTVAYSSKGWVPLLAVSSAGGWLALFVGYLSDLSFRGEIPPDDRLVLQAGVAFVWLLFWLAPVVRNALRRRGSGRVPGHVHAFIVSTPIIALGFTSAIWNLSDPGLARITLAATALYALLTLALRRHPGGLSRTHALVALLFLTHTLVLTLHGDTLLLTLAAEAAILHLVAARYPDRLVSAGAHLLFSVAGFWLASNLSYASGFPGAFRSAPLDPRSFVDLAVIALAFAVSGVVAPRPTAVRVYRISAHVAFLAWLWRELSVLPGGHGWVSVAWGLYAAGLLVAGLRLNRAWFVRGGLATLFLVVGKLFVVDLTGVQAMWRVLLFLGFGGLFLALSYYLRALWRPDPGTDATRRSGAAGGRP